MLRVGIVAGEISGDLLGAGLITALKKYYPDAEFVGIAGPKMIEAGCQSRYPMERLSVMGLVEVLGRYFELRRMRSDLIAYFISHPPDIFIGIDAPEFNLDLELQLKKNNIRTVHYVSPSVWAWRRRRLKKIKRAVDLMLTLFPFEADFYKKQNIPVHFVGHPLADMIPLEPNCLQARESLGIDETAQVVALLPGSRMTELKKLSSCFIQAALQCQHQIPSLVFVAPFATEKTRLFFETILQEQASSLNIKLIDGRSREVMTAANVVLLASGTATLEALLLKKPMVVAYRVSEFTYQILRHMVKVDYLSLPNLLSGEKIVPEFIQAEATADNLSQSLLTYLTNSDNTKVLSNRFTDIHNSLSQDSNNSAALAVQSLLESK